MWVSPNTFFNCLSCINSQTVFSYDSLTLYDGGSTASPMLGKYCGYSIPPSHVSSSNEILIHFQSDEVVMKTGFQIEYKQTGKKHT